MAKRILLLGGTTLVYFLLGFYLGIIVLVVGCFLYLRKYPPLDTVASPLGYSLGMGALVGAAISIIGTLLDVGFVAYATHALGVDPAGMSATLHHLAFSPIAGGIAGLVGGLIAGSMRPKTPSV